MSRYRARHRRHRSPALVLLQLVIAAVLAVTMLPGVAEAAPGLVDETIQGHVTGLDASGNPVPVDNVPVYAQATSGGTYYYGSTGPDGSYSISVPSAGDYDVIAQCSSDSTCAQSWADAFYNDQNSWGDADPLTVTAGTPATADFHLQRWATITGTVTDKAGHPVPNLTVQSFPWGGGSSVSTTTAADGTYTLNQVVPGRDYLQFSDDTGAYRVQNAYWDGTAAVPNVSQPVVIAPGPAVTNASVSLKPWSGLVVDAVNTSGQPLANIGYTVETYNTRTGNWDGPQMGPLLTGGNGQFVWPAAINAKLRFCLLDDYYAPGYNPKYRYVDQCYQNQTSVQNATPVQLSSAHPKFTTTMTLVVAGKSMKPVDPFVTGRSAVGQPLTVDTGTWAPSTVQLSYQWSYYDATTRSFTPIAGATASTFTPTADLRGKYLQVGVTGTAAGYKTATLYGSAYTVNGSTPAMTPAARIGGSPTVGSRVRAVAGTLSPTGASVEYQWLVGGVPKGSSQSGSASLAVTSAMVGQVIELRTLVYAGGYKNQLQTVAQTAPVS